MTTRPLVRMVLTTITALAFLPAITLAAAQPASPPATPVDGNLQRVSAYPVAIHSGTCEDPVAQPEGPAIDAGVANFNVDAPFLGLNIDQPVLEASADYSGSLAYFTEAPHVVAIHASAEDFGTIVACGQIAGYVQDGQVVFALRGQANAAISGVAIMENNTDVVDEVLDLIDRPFELGDDSVSLTVYIIPSGGA